MRILSVVIGGALFLCSVLPAFADAGVSIPLTTVVTGGGSGGGGSYGGGTSYTIPPVLTQPRSGSSYIPPVQQPIALPTPSVALQQSESVTTTDNLVKEEFKIDWFLIACLVTIFAAATGIIIIMIKRRRQY